MKITEMSIKNYEEVAALWQAAEGIGLDTDIDTKERIAMYLQRNPGLSFVAWENSKVIGAVLCGHDGRRGYLHHLTVAKAYRNKGIGKALVEKVLSKLRLLGIRRCHIFVFADNPAGQELWKNIGWTKPADLKIMSKSIML